MKTLEHKLSDNLSNILEKYKIKDKVFAVGVSGGADSLALIYLIDSWAQKHGKKIKALTVNHNLRENSRSEAEYVAKLMQKAGIEHHILTWKGTKSQTGLEEKARTARYSLMENFCNSHKIKSLIIAHHKFDQAETFLMRLQRGSGVDGLSAMSEVSTLGNLKLIRPLLDAEPIEFRQFLNSKNILWCEDEMNYDEDFLRVRVRSLLPFLEEKIGLSVDRIVTTAKVLSRTRDYMEQQTSAFIKKNVKFLSPHIATVSLALLQKQHEEITFRVLSTLLKNIAQKPYIPRAEDVERLCSSLKDFHGKTLHGCEIINSDNNLWIFPEIKDKKVLSKKVWEQFLELNPQYKKIKLPYKVRKALSF